MVLLHLVRLKAMVTWVEDILLYLVCMYILQHYILIQDNRCLPPPSIIKTNWMLALIIFFMVKKEEVIGFSQILLSFGTSKTYFVVCVLKKK